MHRSGTSAVTRVVNLLGIPLGRADDLYSAVDNPSGHWESTRLCALNDVILQVFGGFDMGMPPMPRSWLRSRRAQHLRGVMRATFDDVFQSDRWLWKDPRLCLTLPLWRQVLDDFCIVFVVREAGPVTRSLHHRGGFPLLYCHALWDDYNRRASAAVAGLPVVRVDFDTMMADPLSHVKLLSESLVSLGVELTGDIGEAATSLLRPSDPGRQVQRSHRLATALKSGPSASAVYQPPPLPGQPWWVRPTLRAGRTWIRILENQTDRRGPAAWRQQC
jgi:hypothetical protein